MPSKVDVAEFSLSDADLEALTNKVLIIMETRRVLTEAKEKSRTRTLSKAEEAKLSDLEEYFGGYIRGWIRRDEIVTKSYADSMERLGIRLLVQVGVKKTWFNGGTLKLEQPDAN